MADFNPVATAEDLNVTLDDADRELTLTNLPIGANAVRISVDITNHLDPDSTLAIKHKQREDTGPFRDIGLTKRKGAPPGRPGDAAMISISELRAGTETVRAGFTSEEPLDVAFVRLEVGIYLD